MNGCGAQRNSVAAEAALLYNKKEGLGACRVPKCRKKDNVEQKGRAGCIQGAKVKVEGLAGSAVENMSASAKQAALSQLDAAAMCAPLFLLLSTPVLCMHSVCTLSVLFLKIAIALVKNTHQTTPETPEMWTAPEMVRLLGILSGLPTPTRLPNFTPAPRVAGRRRVRGLLLRVSHQIPLLGGTHCGRQTACQNPCVACFPSNPVVGRYPGLQADSVSEPLRCVFPIKSLC